MPTIPVPAFVTWFEDRLTIVTVTGEIDRMCSEELTQALIADGDLVADFSGVTFCDSSGLSALVDAHRRQAGAGRRFVVVSERRCVLCPLTLMGLDRMLTLRPTLEAARAELATPMSTKD